VSSIRPADSRRRRNLLAAVTVFALSAASLVGWLVVAPGPGSASGPAREEPRARLCVTPAIPPSTGPSTGPSSGPSTGPAAGPGWTGAWSTAQQRLDGPPVSGRTLRQLVHPTVGGSALRIRVANTFATTPLWLRAVSVGVSLDRSSPALRPGTAHAVTFTGGRRLRVPPGGLAISDVIALPVRYGQTLAVDFSVEKGVADTGHARAVQTSYSAAGDHTGEPSGAAFSVPSQSWFWLDGVDVLAGPGAGSIAVLGDSLTDGTYTTMSADHRWPDVLADRLHRVRGGHRTGVLNAGIGGNRVTKDTPDCVTPSASGLRRFDRDVLSRSHLRAVIIAEGINDIVAGVPAPTLIAGLRTLAERAHARGLPVIGATITPFGCGHGCLSAEREAVRQDVNRWIRTTPVFDQTIDFDRVVRDPADPQRLRPSFDHGDHLHLNDAGDAAMGDAFAVLVERSILTLSYGQE